MPSLPCPLRSACLLRRSHFGDATLWARGGRLRGGRNHGLAERDSVLAGREEDRDVDSGGVLPPRFARCCLEESLRLSRGDRRGEDRHGECSGTPIRNTG
jgi:hypothetical protein